MLYFVLYANILFMFSNWKFKSEKRIINFNYFKEYIRNVKFKIVDFKYNESR